MPSTYLGKIVESIEPTHVTKHEVNDKEYAINYVDDTNLRRAGLNLLGYTYQKKIYIRNGLPKHVERALIRHEAYHVQDNQQWLGKYGKELRANTHTVTHDPLGFLATLIYSLNAARLKTYWRLYIYPRNLN